MEYQMAMLANACLPYNGTFSSFFGFFFFISENFSELLRVDRETERQRDTTHDESIYSGLARRFQSIRQLAIEDLEEGNRDDTNEEGEGEENEFDEEYNSI
jgi:hypothetical protein